MLLDTPKRFAVYSPYDPKPLAIFICTCEDGPCERHRRRYKYESTTEGYYTRPLNDNRRRTINVYTCEPHPDDPRYKSE